MGNQALANEFKSGKWFASENLGYRQILQNSQTHAQAEKHFTMSKFVNQQERYQNTQIYKWRKQLSQDINIVKLYEYQLKQYRFGIQQDQYAYTEKVYRLSQKAKPYSKPEGLLLIMDLLKGLDILFQQFGIFNIDIFLLGVSFEGKGKVWINQNYARNYVQEKHLIQYQGPNQELVIVNNLVRIVRQRVYNEDFIPEVQFPVNMRIRQAIDYIFHVRNNYALLRIDKIYLDRNQFKIRYDELCHAQNSPRQGFLINQFQQSPHHLASVIDKQLEIKKNKSHLQLNYEPSETLSSDSNSRAKSTAETIRTQPIQSQSRKLFHDKKIHIQQMIVEQNSVKDIKNSIELHSFPINPHFQKNQVPHLAYQQNNAVFVTPNFQQRFISHANIPQHAAIPRAVGYSNNQIINNAEQMPFIMQKRIIENRPVIYQQVIPQTRNFFKPNINEKVQHPFIPNFSQPVHQVQQKRQSFQSSEPFMRQKVVNVQRKIQHFPEPQHMFYSFQNQNQQGFINDVEVCQSVMLDRDQLQRNLDELER